MDEPEPPPPIDGPAELAGDSRLVEARLRFLERHRRRIAALPERFAGRAPLGSGAPNRHGMPSLPVGQRPVKNWPVLDLGDQPRIPPEEWRLEIGGRVEQAVTLDFDALLALPQVEDESDFHCVTTWSRLDNHWRGVRLRTLAELVVPLADARFVLTEGYDRLPGTEVPYTTNLPLERALEDDVLLVHEWEGAPLPPEHGGPVRMITPKLYAWKGAKWIRRIEFAVEDRPGFWEVRGYSNTAEPWFDDRYAQR